MKPLTLYRHLHRGQLKWYPHQGVLYRAFLNKLKEGDTVEIQLKKQGRKKTNPQLGYWYGVLVPCVVDGLIEAGYNTLASSEVYGIENEQETNKKTVDELLKKGYKQYKSLEKVPEKTHMTTEEMSDLIDYALEWAATNLGIFIPTPREM